MPPPPPPAILCAHIASGCGLLSLSELLDEDELLELEDDEELDELLELEELDEEDDELSELDELLLESLLPANGFLYVSPIGNAPPRLRARDPTRSNTCRGQIPKAPPILDCSRDAAARAMSRLNVSTTRSGSSPRRSWCRLNVAP
jgi:hypothetical protein